ncbi:unnamed protein product [Discula destructiva]
MTQSTSRTGYSQEQYDRQLAGYRQYENVPWGVLEDQLHGSALGDCTGMTVLDLGGGSGLRARQSLDHGAIAVDVVDVSPEMMQLGKNIEESLGRGPDTLQWFEADVSRPEILSRLPLRYKTDGYDMVMANWLFDHAGSTEVLDGMMQSCVKYLKPGGRFIGTRILNGPGTPAASDGKYGVTYNNLVDIPGGVSFRYKVHVDHPVEFEAASMAVTYDPKKINEFHSRYGLEDTQFEPFESASWIRSDPDYWKLFTDCPNFAVVKAKKT